MQNLCRFQVRGEGQAGREGDPPTHRDILRHLARWTVMQSRRCQFPSAFAAHSIRNLQQHASDASPKTRTSRLSRILMIAEVVQVTEGESKKTLVLL